MTPERLAFLIDHCYRRRGRDSLIAYRRDVAGFLGITPRTLRRYLTGAQPIPRQIEVILEILHHYPAITAETVEFLLRHANDQAPDDQ
jgi:hypothetical protein